MTLPVDIFVSAIEDKVFATTRTGGAAGAGVWSTPTLLLDVNTSPWPTEAIGDLTAGILTDAGNWGVIANAGDGFPIYIGDGPPAAPVQPLPGVIGNIPNFFGTSMGAATFGGAKFAVVANHPGGFNPTVIVSDDDGATWAVLDGSNAPTGTWVVFAMVQQVGNYFYLLLSKTSGTTWAVYPFNLATREWETSFAPLTFTLKQDFLNFYTNGLFSFANGDFGVIGNDASNVPVYLLWTQSTGLWSSAVFLPGMNYANSIIDPNGELIHGWNYSTNTGEVEVSPVNYYTVSHGGTVTNYSTIPAPVDISGGDGVDHAAIINGLIFAPRDDFADNFNSVWVASLADPTRTWFKESLGNAAQVLGPPTCSFMNVSVGVAVVSNNYASSGGSLANKGNYAAAG